VGGSGLIFQFSTRPFFHPSNPPIFSRRSGISLRSTFSRKGGISAYASTFSRKGGISANASTFQFSNQEICTFVFQNE